MPRKEPPIGVKILAGLAGIAGILMIATMVGFASIFPSIGGFFGLLGFLYVAYAYGLWNMKNWAWWVAIFTSILGILSNISYATQTFIIFLLLWNFIVIAYLYQNRKLFGIKGSL